MIGVADATSASTQSKSLAFCVQKEMWGSGGWEPPFPSKPAEAPAAQVKFHHPWETSVAHQQRACWMLSVPRFQFFLRFLVDAMRNKGPSPYYWLDMLEKRLYIPKWKPRNRPCLGTRPRRTCPSGNASDNFGFSNTRRCRSRLRPARGARLWLPAVRRTWVRSGISVPTRARGDAHLPWQCHHS